MMSVHADMILILDALVDQVALLTRLAWIVIPKLLDVAMGTL